MTPLQFELAVLWRSRLARLAFLLACAPPALGLLFLAGARGWPVQPSALARVWLPTVFVVASATQAGLLPLIQLALLGDSLAGQLADHRRRTVLGCPVAHWRLYLGKLASAFLFSVAVLAVSVALYLVAALVAGAGSDALALLLERGYETSLPGFCLLFLACQAGLVAYLGLLFALSDSFKSGLLLVPAVTVALLALQYGALRAPESYALLSGLTFTSHYIHGLGIESLIAASVGRLGLEAAHWKLLAGLVCDVVIFGGLGCLAFRHQQP